MPVITVRLSHRAVAARLGRALDDSRASDDLRAEFRLAVEGAVEDAYPDASLDVGWAGELTEFERHVAHVRLSGGGTFASLPMRHAVEDLVRRAAQDAIDRHLEVMP